MSKDTNTSQELNHDRFECAYSGGIKNLSEFTDVYTRDTLEMRAGGAGPTKSHQLLIFLKTKS